MSVGRGGGRGVKTFVRTDMASLSTVLMDNLSALKVSSGVAAHQLVAMRLHEKEPEYRQNESLSPSNVAPCPAFGPAAGSGRAGIAFDWVRLGGLREQNGRGAGPHSAHRGREQEPRRTRGDSAAQERK